MSGVRTSSANGSSGKSRDRGPLPRSPQRPGANITIHDRAGSGSTRETRHDSLVSPVRPVELVARQTPR